MLPEEWLEISDMAWTWQKTILWDTQKDNLSNPENENMTIFRNKFISEYF